MAVLVEAISVIVRRGAIDDHYAGGWEGFLRSIPICPFCTDDELVRLSFMTPSDVGIVVGILKEGGLTFLREGKAIDMAVVDQIRGPTTTAEWLEFAHLNFEGSGNKVAACWLYEGPRMGHGTHMTSLNMTLATPEGWTYENSITARCRFVSNEEREEKLKFLRREGAVDVYLDLTTGKELYMGRTQS